MRHQAERRMPELAVLGVLFALFLAISALRIASAAERSTADGGAASPPPLETLTAEQVNALIARLSDAEVRELLLQQLDRRSPERGAAATGADAVSMVADRAQTIRYRLGEMIAALPDAPYAALFVVDQLTGDRDPRRILDIALALALIFVAATGGEHAFRRLFGPVGGRVAQMSSSEDFGKLALLAARAFVDFLALAVFALVGTLVFFVVHPDKDFPRVAFWSAIPGASRVRAVAIVVHALLAPRRPDLRLPRLRDASARRLYRWLVGLAALAGSGPHAFARLLVPAGLPEPLTIALGRSAVAPAGHPDRFRLARTARDQRRTRLIIPQTGQHRSPRRQGTRSAHLCADRHRPFRNDLEAADRRDARLTPSADARSADRLAGTRRPHAHDRAPHRAAT